MKVGAAKISCLWLTLTCPPREALRVVFLQVISIGGHGVGALVGVVLGVELGTLVGVVLGAELGILVGVVLGDELGTLVGTVVGALVSGLP
jgi:hypothetical protein